MVEEILDALDARECNKVPEDTKYGLQHYIAKRKNNCINSEGDSKGMMTEAQSTISCYLKRFIGEIDCKNLQLFLHRSDVMLIEFIETYKVPPKTSTPLV